MKGVSVGTMPARSGRDAELRFTHRFRRLGPLGRSGRGLPGDSPVDVSIVLAGAWQAPSAGMAGLRAGARFLIDGAWGAVEPAELARMIGCFAFAAVAGQGMVDVSLRGVGGPPGAARLRRPAFEVEANGFGAAHVLFENAVLGLYLLEVAPGRAIPAHFHRVMREAELVLDAGLVQQDRAVSPGDAFVWPAGYVHAYANPTGAAKRILCIDRPKFIPEDEVVVAGPVELVAVAPERNYLGDILA